MTIEIPWTTVVIIAITVFVLCLVVVIRCVSWAIKKMNEISRDRFDNDASWMNEE